MNLSINSILWIAAFVLIAFLSMRISYLSSANSKLRFNNAELEEQLKSKVVVEKDKLIYVYRDKENKPKQEEVYIPHAGSVTVVTPKDNEEVNLSTIDNLTSQVIETDTGTILVKYRGFTISPEISLFYAGVGPEVGLQTQLAFWGRYGAGIGIGHRSTLYGFAERNISDIIPVAKNTNFMINIGKNLKDQKVVVGAGLSVHF